MPHQNGGSYSGRSGHHHHHHHYHGHRDDDDHHHHDKLSGHKRDSCGGMRESRESYVKLFVGSVPRNISEEEVRPMFAEFGAVLEVALIKDKRTGHQQGCCFVKYSSREEADRAVRFLNNKRTLPGGNAAVQVRYADGERERIGAVEHKLFVGCLNRQASEKEIEEIFAPYGRVEDVYIMRDLHKQNRGSAFIKFTSRESAQTAIKGLNNIYVMRGCDVPLVVRFADPKRTKTSDWRDNTRDRGGGLSHSSRPGSGSSRSSGGGRSSPVHWRGGSRQTQAPPSFPQAVSRLSPPRHAVTPQPNSFPVDHHLGQAIFSAPQGLPLERQVFAPQQVPQINQPQQQLIYAPPPPEQVIHLQQMQLPPPPPQPQPQATFSQVQQVLQPQFGPGQPNQMQVILQHHQSLPQQQQQQHQPMFQQNPGPQQQQPWLISLPPQLVQPQMALMQSSAPPPPLPPPPPAPITCNWTEHVSPEGFKYYHNSVTAESKWDKPDELLKLEQQQLQQPQSMSFPSNSALDQFRSQI